MISRRLANAIILVVTAVWALVVTAPYWDPGAPEPHPAIYAVFMVIVGGALKLRPEGDGPGVVSRVLASLRPPAPPQPPTPPTPESETTP